MYQKYYKLGLDHFLFKKVFGLKKPSIKIHFIYFAIITGVIALSELF